MNDFGRTYAELNDEERKIVDERMKEMRKEDKELNLEELEQVTAGIKHNFEGADISGVQFRKADEQDVTKDPIIDSTKVANHNLSSVQLQDHNRKINFEGTDISGVQLKRTDEQGILGGTTSDIGKEAFNGTFSEPIKNIDLVDEDGNELTNDRQK